MSLTPEQVSRVTPPIGSDWDIAKNRDHVAAGTAGKLTANDFTATTTGREGLWIEYKMLAGFPVDHGEVADEAAMIGLHNWAADPLTTASYHYVVPGDSCTRTDDPGFRWHCLAGNGLWTAQWERRPLAAAVATAAGSAVWGGVTGDLSEQADLTDALGTLAPLASPALTGAPTAPTPPTGDSSTRIATTAMVAAAVAAGGGGGGGAIALLASGGLTADAATIDITGIPGTSEHLKLVLSLRGTTSTTSVTMLLRVNGDTTAANYRGSRAAIQGGTFYHAQNAGSAASIVYSCEVTDSAALANSFTGYEVTFWEYASTSKVKTARNHGGYCQATATANYLTYDSIGIWNSTSAITRLTISLAAGNIAAGSTWSLYGLS